MPAQRSPCNEVEYVRDLLRMIPPKRVCQCCRANAAYVRMHEIEEHHTPLCARTLFTVKLFRFEGLEKITSNARTCRSSTGRGSCSNASAWSTAMNNFLQDSTTSLTTALQNRLIHTRYLGSWLRRVIREETVHCNKRGMIVELIHVACQRAQHNNMKCLKQSPRCIAKGNLAIAAEHHRRNLNLVALNTCLAYE